MQTEAFVVLTLSHLLQNGVTAEDIINTSKFFTDFVNNRFFLDSRESGKDMTGKDITKPRDRIEEWKAFLGKLRELGEINSAIMERKAKLTEMEKQVSDSKNQKQEIDASHNTSGSISDYKDDQILYLNWFLNQIFKHIEQKIKESFRLYTLSINVIYIKSDNDDKQPN